MTEQVVEGFNPGVLDLSDADTSAASFEAVPANRYMVEVWDAEWQKTKEDSTGTLGGDWPYINVQIRITEGEYENRRLFTKFFPKVPEGYDPKKAARNKGAFVNFLVALGYKEEEVKSANFTLDFEAMKARPFIAVVSKDPIKKAADAPPDAATEYENNIKGFKAIGDTSTDTPGTGNAAGLL